MSRKGRGGGDGRKACGHFIHRFNPRVRQSLRGIADVKKQVARTCAFEVRGSNFRVRGNSGVRAAGSKNYVQLAAAERSSEIRKWGGRRRVVLCGSQDFHELSRAVGPKDRPQRRRSALLPWPRSERRRRTTTGFNNNVYICRSKYLYTMLRPNEATICRL